MNEAIITYVAPLKSLEDRILGHTEICFWQISQEQKFAPNSTIVSLEHKIPSKAISINNFSLQKAIEEDFSMLYDYLENKYKNIKDSLISELSNTKNPESKTYKKKEKVIQAINLFLKTQNNRVYLEKTIIDTNIIYTLHIPFLNSSDFPIGFSHYFQNLAVHKKYNSFSSSVKKQLGFPFSKIDLETISNSTINPIRRPDNLTMENKDIALIFNSFNTNPINQKNSLKQIAKNPTLKDINFILSQKALALDIETTNYIPLLPTNDILTLSEKELREILENNNVLSKKEIELKDKSALIRLATAFLDQKRDERITTISLASMKSNQNYLLTTLESNIKIISVDSPIDALEIDFEIIKYSSQQELIDGLLTKIQEINPVFVYGHNQLKFDYQKISDFSKNGFNGGINNKPLKHMHSILGQYIVQRILPGRIDLDPALYSQFYMSNKNNKLDQVFETLTGVFSKKTLSHKELEEYTKLAEQGSTKKAKEILYYAAQDVLKSYIIGELLKKEHILLSRLYSSLPSRIDTTSPKTLTEQYWTNRHLEKFKNYPNQDIALETIILPKKNKKENKSKGLKGQNLGSVKFHDFNSLEFYLNELSSKTKKIQTKTGLNKAYLIYINPVLNSFIHILRKDENVLAICDELNNSDSQKKLRLSRSLNYLSEYLYFKYTQSQTQFLKEFGLIESELDYKTISKKLSDGFQILNKIFSSNDFLNIKDDLILLKRTPSSTSILNEIESSKIGFSLGEYNSLCGPKGTMIGSNSNWSFMLGISEADSKRGEKTPLEAQYEKELFEVLINQNDKLKAVLLFASYANKIKKDLDNYNLDDLVLEKSYQVEKTLRRDACHFSSHSMSNYKKTAIKNHSKLGDTIILTKTKRELYLRFFNFLPITLPINHTPKNLIEKSKMYNQTPYSIEKIKQDYIDTKNSIQYEKPMKQTYKNRPKKPASNKINTNQIPFNFMEPSLFEDLSKYSKTNQSTNDTDLIDQIVLEEAKIDYNPNQGKLTRILSWAFGISHSNLKKRAFYKMINNDYLDDYQSKNPDKILNSNENLLTLAKLIISE